MAKSPEEEPVLRTQRIPILAVAIGLAGVTALATFNYVNSADKRAQDDAELVEAFVVTKDIPKGFPGEDALDADYISKEWVPKKLYPAKAIVDAQSLRGKVALAPLAAGLPIVDGAFVEPRLGVESFAQRIDKGMQAVTLSVNDVQGVARLIVPGDRVNLLLTSEANNAPAGPGGEVEHETAFALQGIEVLAVGNAAELQPGEAVPIANNTQAGTVATIESSLITFEVPALDAARLVHASHEGPIHLTLVPNDFTPEPVPPVNRANLFN
jgi:pilus assembly protein CpaB